MPISCGARHPIKKEYCKKAREGWGGAIGADHSYGAAECPVRRGQPAHPVSSEDYPHFGIFNLDTSNTIVKERAVSGHGKAGV